MEHLMTDQSNDFFYAEYYVNLPTNYKSSKSYFLHIFKIIILHTHLKYLPYTHQNKNPTYTACVHAQTHTHTITACHVKNRTNIFTVELEDIVYRLLMQCNAKRHCIYLPVDT